MKKTLAIVLALMMVLGTLGGVAFAANTADVWDGSIDTSWYDKDATAPTFEITTAEELAGLAQLVNDGTSFANKTITLTADIDLNQEDWTPIGGGAYGKHFTGTFDGGNKTISNLWVTSSNYGSIGLFGYIGATETGIATVKNLTVNNATVINQSADAVGAVVGYSGADGRVMNVHVTGDITIAGYRGVAAVVGKGYADIYNSTVRAEGSISASYWCAGGILGHDDEPCVEIDGCTVTGVGEGLTIGNGSYAGAGGICGYTVGGSVISNCAVKDIEITGDTYYHGGYIAGNGYTNPNGNNEVVNAKVIVDGSAIIPEDAEGVTIIVATIGENQYTSLEAAFKEVANGEEIDLCADVALEKGISFAKDIAFTLDGNGHKIYPSATSTETNSAFNVGMGDDSTVATRKYTFKNITFSGWTTDHVLRLQGVDAVVDNCTFTNNNQARTDALGLLTLTFCDAEVTKCTFTDNVCVKAIDINSWGDGSTKDAAVDNCVFEKNTVSGPGVIYYNDGNSAAVTNSEFTNNTVSTTGNGATVYMGFNDGIVVTGNMFKNNTVSTTKETMRIAGAVFAGFVGNACEISENVFMGNSATKANGVAAASAVAYSAAYGAGDISNNYWNNGTEPVAGADFTHEYATTNPLKVDSYYTAYSTNANGNLVFTDSKDIVDEIAVAFVKASEDEGELVYNINLTADGKIINRLNSVDLTFALTQVDGTNDFEIIASNDEVVINPVENSKYRYEFHYDGKTGVETDTAATITIGQVKLTGYGKFIFAVDTDATTNVAHATKNDNNIVDTFIPNGNGANGNLDITKATTGAVIIKIPVRDLTINIAFPNAVKNNAAAYQDMTVTIVGGETDIIRELGADVDEDAAYTITEKLPYNTAYTVTVTGAGYRTARYTVTLNDHKTLNFWNNVMDEEKEVEVGKDSSKTTKNFLAGDIVKDNNINIYDLSAVVSYFASTSTIDNGYAKYDLNRDGVIDSKDVAYVLVSWNN